MTAAFYFHVQPWFVMLIGGWSAHGRRLLANGWNARLWGVIEGVSVVIALIGIFDPSLVRWGQQ